MKFSTLCIQASGILTNIQNKITNSPFQFFSLNYMQLVIEGQILHANGHNQCHSHFEHSWR